MMIIQSDEQSVILDYDFDEAQYRRDMDIMAAEAEVGDVLLFGAQKTAKYKAAQAFLKDYAAGRDLLLKRVEQILNRARKQMAIGVKINGSAVSGQTAGAQHKTTGDSDGDSDGDPDPADEVINDPYSSINTHLLSRPINRIARKAILANRQGVEQKNPGVYNWYVTLTLKEIERAMRSVLRKKATLSQDSLDEIPLAAVRLFLDLSMDNKHRFECTPNLVFTRVVEARCFQTTFKLHEYVTPDNRNPGVRESRKEALSIGIADRSSRAYAADVYSVANRLTDVKEEQPAFIRVCFPAKESITPSTIELDAELDGVRIQHCPPKPVRISPERASAQMVSFNRDDDDDDTGGGDALELDALDALDAAAFDPAGHDEKRIKTRREYGVLNVADMEKGYLPDDADADLVNAGDAENDVQIEVYTDNPDTREIGGIDYTPASVKAKRAAETALYAQAGTIARQVVLYVTRALDQTAAAREVAGVLNQQEGALGNLVLNCIRKDLSATDVCAKILKAAQWADAEALFCRPAEPDLDPELVRLGRMSDITLSGCRAQYVEQLYETVGTFRNRGNLLSALKTRALNKMGKFPEDVVRVARLLTEKGDK